MNAAERANSIAAASHIAAVTNAFKAQFPAVRIDLKPWATDAETQEWIDPDSIDIGFHFPGMSRSCACRCILMQIRFFRDPLEGHHRAIGLEMLGYDYRGQQWRFSTVERWQFSGNAVPDAAASEKLKAIGCQVLDVFNRPPAEEAS